MPGKTAQAIGEKYGLQQWASTLFSPPTSTTKSAAKSAAKSSAMSRQKSVDEGTKKELLNILLEVYMSDKYVLPDASTL